MSADSRLLVLDASAVVRLICRDPAADSWAAQLGKASMVLALACHLDHPLYDCLYLALARREAATLLTADQRLQRLAATVLP